MKRLLNKYTLLLLLPLIMLIAGCDIANTIGSGGDDSLDIPLDVPSVDVPAKNEAVNGAEDKIGMDKTTEEKKGEDEIALSDKSSVIDIDAGGRLTPFVPYKERNLSYNSLNYGDLPYPPMAGEVNEDINNLVSAKVTGILYDPKSPSAIINVLGDDYLVKPGDKVESFQIATISKDYVSIKTGSNAYRAKVGDIVEGEVYGTGIYNLGHRFAGSKYPARKEDVFVVSTKKQAENSQHGDIGFNDLSLPPIPQMRPNQAAGLLPDASGNLPKINLKTQAGEIPLPVGNNTKK